MFERRSKIVNLDTIGELCKSSKIKDKQDVIVKESIKVTKSVDKIEAVAEKKEEKQITNYKTNKSEETILWL